MDDEHLIETTVARQVLHEGRFLTFRIDTVEDAAGQRHHREIAAHPGAVCIVALLGEAVLLVRQFRTPVGSVVTELPAGTLDRLDDGSTEAPDDAAPRELKEETGYRARTWTSLGRFWTAPGFTDELMHLYLATELEAVEGHTGPEPDEHLDVVTVPWREALSMAERGQLQDAKTLVGLLRLGRLVESGKLRWAAGRWHATALAD